MNNDLLIGAVFFALGLIPTYFFYLRTIRIKEPVYFIDNERIIYGFESTVPNLKITYRKKAIEDLSISTIVFYNRGAETITQQDIDTINHLKIIGNNDTKILDATIEKYNNPASNFNVILDKNEVIINFDYINRNQGAVILVIHTGKSAEDIQLVGDIRGVEKISHVSKRTKYEELAIGLLAKMNDRRIVRYFMLPAAVVAYTCIIAFITLSLIFPERDPRPEPSSVTSNIIAYSTIVLSVIMIFVTTSITRIFYNRNRYSAPAGLEY